jgi:hypothetical protein
MALDGPTVVAIQTVTSPAVNFTLGNDMRFSGVLSANMSQLYHCTNT